MIYSSKKIFRIMLAITILGFTGFVISIWSFIRTTIYGNNDEYPFFVLVMILLLLPIGYLWKKIGVGFGNVVYIKKLEINNKEIDPENYLFSENISSINPIKKSVFRVDVKLENKEKLRLNVSTFKNDKLSITGEDLSFNAKFNKKIIVEQLKLEEIYVP